MIRAALMMLDWLVYAGGIAFLALYAAPAWGIVWAFMMGITFIGIAIPALGYVQFKLGVKPPDFSR